MSPFPLIVPDTLKLLEQLTSSACLIRNEHYQLVWCNEAYERLSGETLEEMQGSSLHDYLPTDSADEREATYAEALRTQSILRVIQFGADERMLSVMIPIDSKAFGYRGVLTILQHATNIGKLISDDYDIVLRTPCMIDLAQLSTSELRVLYHISLGKVTRDIAITLERATRTIENQIASIHSKLKTNSRAELVKYVVDRGIHGFSEEEWELIIKAERDLKPMNS